MFQNSPFNGDISAWDTSKVTNFGVSDFTTAWMLCKRELCYSLLIVPVTHASLCSFGAALCVMTTANVQGFAIQRRHQRVGHVERNEFSGK